MEHLGDTLLEWYKQNGRKLPWRRTRDPYRILVSEIMLQQTQVEHVLHYYKRFLKQFPDWKSLAQASNADLLNAWAGLGYNRRALNLREIARTVLKHGVPTTEKEWQSIKGIGPYTAAAICAFSLKQRTLPIDTNIRRVLGRYHLGVLFPTLKTDKRIETTINKTLPVTGNFFDVPQALFDLATSTCQKEPLCDQCPLRNTCKASKRFLKGEVRIPKTTKQTKERIRTGKKHPDRIYRGRILEIARKKTTPIHKLGPMIDPTFSDKDQNWIQDMVNRMIKDGLIQQKDHSIFV